MSLKAADKVQYVYKWVSEYGRSKIVKGDTFLRLRYKNPFQQLEINSSTLQKVQTHSPLRLKTMNKDENQKVTQGIKYRILWCFVPMIETYLTYLTVPHKFTRNTQIKNCSITKWNMACFIS